MMALQNRKVLLIVDNASGHNVTPQLLVKLTHVELEYLEPNTTSKVQPADQGIIRTFKAKYRKN
jgi:hypothetical protein